ncbi:unnamed protein product [Calypogeia fissa]
MASKGSITLQVTIQEVSFIALQEKQQRPDEVVTVVLAPRAKKTVSWAPDVVDGESCKHCNRCANKKRGANRSRGSPTRRYLKSLVHHLLA